jgi:hypothetical protein
MWKVIFCSLFLSSGLCLTWQPCHSQSLEDGVVISDPEVVHVIESSGFRFTDLIALRSAKSTECAAHRGGPFSKWPLCYIAETLRKRVADGQKLTLDPTARHEADASTRFPVDFFDDDQATLTLVGIINRMDRAFRPARNLGTSREAVCGEIRLIYRFGYDEHIANERVSSRLPLTLNLVMRARRPGQQEDCAAIAKKWLDFPQLIAGLPNKNATATAQVLLQRGPLSLLKADQIDRLEVNMQILRLAALSKQDFGTHAEYLLSVFNWDRARKFFDGDILENQIDPNLGLPDRGNESAFKGKLARFKSFLLSDASLFDLDRGQIIIPQEFVARSAISVAPGGSARSQNGPLNAILGSQRDCQDQSKRGSVLCSEEISRALANYERRKPPLKNIRSVAGFITRVNDSSCTGCHQTRAIAGFHFTGADREATFPANEVLVPGSPHFFGDLPRRTAILRQLASGIGANSVNFSRGFSARPEQRFESSLASTTLFNGWGASCNVKAGTPQADRSFSDWTCASGLACAPYMPSATDPDRGICVSEVPAEIGDPLEVGHVVVRAFGDDIYQRDAPNKVKAYEDQDTSLNTVDGRSLADRLHLPDGPPKNSFVAAQQEAWVQRKTGGFPGGMLRTNCCEGLPANATCGQVAVNGFNDCLNSKSTPFTQCFRNYVNYSGLRACNANTPCREDYICLRPMLSQSKIQQSYLELKRLDREYSCMKPDESWLTRANMGTCIPPYFVLQFRADKHHTSSGGEIGRE